MRFLHLIVAAAISLSAAVKAEDTVHYPSPLQTYDERFAEHDERITELEDRVLDLEGARSERPRDVRVQLVITKEGEVERAKEPKTDSGGTNTTVVSTSRVVSRPAARPANNVRRLKSSSQLRAEIAQRRTSRVEVGIRPKTMRAVTQHLLSGAPDHRYRYQGSQLSGLSFSELEMLHSLNHGSRAINPYTSGSAARLVTQPAAQPVEIFTPTPRTPRSPGPPTYTPPCGGGGCPNGRCPLQRSTSQTRWYPGKLLFGG